MKFRREILQALSGGSFRSGKELGDSLGISRSAVWKHVKALRQLGLDVYAVRGKGYRLSLPLELLDHQVIFSAIPVATRSLVSAIEVQLELESTSEYLVRKARGGALSGHICFAERQTAGRGRRGRVWISPLGGNLYFSILWRFPEGPQSLGGLGLAVGVGIARALQKSGLGDVELKWPNDIYWRGMKLGGVLLEMFGESAGPCGVVIGIGVNVRMPGGVGTAIGQPWVDLETAIGRAVSRNKLAAIVTHEVFSAVREFQLGGLGRFLAEWRDLDALAGKQVRLVTPSESLVGTAVGVDANGALLLRKGGQVRRYYSGDVSLRLVS